MPSEKKGGEKKHYFENTYVTCHGKVVLNRYCLVAFQTAEVSSAMVGEDSYLQI